MEGTHSARALMRAWRGELLPDREQWKIHPLSNSTAGQPIESDLVPRVSIESSDFRQWFGASIVKHPDGRPLTFYHGTFYDFSEFDAARSGQPHPFAPVERGEPAYRRRWLGFFFTRSVRQASFYGYNLMHVHLKITNPKVVQHEYEMDLKERDLAKLQLDGFDAIVRNRPGRFGHDLVAVVFSPHQIKVIRREHIGDNK